MNFEVVKSNIINIAADAIVLPANRHLKEGSGTSRAIFEAAGRRELTQACRKIGYCEIGRAVPTPAFHLKADYIIHAVVPRWIDGNHNEYGLLSSAYNSSMNIADIMGCTSIAFPLLASGNNGFDTKLAFNIAEESIRLFQGEHLKKVILVLYGYRISLYASQRGYQVSEIPDIGSRHPDNRQAEYLKKIMSDQLERGLRWMSEKENQEKVIRVGTKIASAIINRH